MFDLFKRNIEKRPDDIKGLRAALLGFIKEELQKSEGGEGGHIKGIYLFFACRHDERYLYEAAVHFEEKDRFKNEIQKIADDFALNIPENWIMEITFADELPIETISIPGLTASVFIQTTVKTIQKTGAAYIRILNGQAEKEEYNITSDSGKITIGREKKVQADDGFFRFNTIAFPGDCGNESNKYISRQHAHIEWNNDAGCFMLFADEGGIPPKNKIKIHSVDDPNLIKLNSTHIGHHLKEGDQIILGESAVVAFSYIPGGL